MWCQVQPPSPHQPTISHPCPRSRPWPRTQTAAALTHWRDHWTRVSEHSPWPHVSVCLLASVPIYNIQISLFLSPLCSLIPPFSEFFCSTFFFYAAFLFFTLQPQWIGLFFYFLFVCDDVETSDFVFGLLLRGQSYLSCLLGQRFIFLFLMDIV